MLKIKIYNAQLQFYFRYNIPTYILNSSRNLKSIYNGIVHEYSNYLPCF